MKTLDSRSRNFGILVLRHEGFDTQPGYDESNPIGLLAKNVTGRQKPMAGGRFIDRKNSIGNVMPWLLWAKDTRKSPGHAPVWPAVVAGDLEESKIPTKVTPSVGGSGGLSQSGGTVRTGVTYSGTPNNATPQPQIEPQRGKTTALPSESVSSMLPVKTSAMYADKRFAPIGYATPLDPYGRGALWPLFPKGYYGLALPATDEPQQVNLFYPCDPRLIAVNNGNEPAMGSMVCDTNDDDELDPDRVARLQSAFRVIKSPYNSRANGIALQLSRSENDDCPGGMMIDHNRGDTIGMLSMLYGGPFDVGDHVDPNHLGNDGDGNAMNAMKLSLQSIFQHKQARDMCGPLHHEGYWDGAQDFPFAGFVEFKWDPAIQKHRWRGKVPIYIPNTDTPTKTPPPEDKKKPPKIPDEPTPGGKNNPPGGGGVPPGAPGGCDVGGPPPDPQGPSPAGQPPNVPSGPSGGTAGDGPGGDTAGDGPPVGPGVPWDPDGGFGPDYPPGYDPQKDGPWGPGAGKPPPPGAGGDAPPPIPPGGGAGGGVVPVGPLEGGDDGFGGWDPNPFGGLFGWKPGVNGSKKKQAERAKKKADKKAKKDKKKKDKEDKKKKQPKGVRFHDGHDPGDLKIPGVNVPEPFRHGPGPKFGGLPQFRFMPPAVPNALSGDAHPEIPKGGGGGGSGAPTPTTSVPTPGTVITPPARGPMPAGAIPGPQCPPAMVNELMIPSIILRPQCYSLSAPDLRYDNNPNLVDVVMHDRTTPITGHIQAYGPQGGAVGSNPGLSAPRSWLYTKRPRAAGGRWWQGSASGGAWMTTPETDLADMNTRLNPQNVVQSESYFGVAPRCYFGVGLPDLARGGMFLGYRFGSDRSGNATFDRMDASGLATPIVELGADGVVSILPRGNGAGEGGQLRLESPDGLSTVSFQAPDSAASNLVFVMPDADPVAGDALSVDSVVGDTVTLSWSAAGGSPSMASIFGQTADATVGNTGAETSMMGTGVGAASIPAGTWFEGMSARTLLRGSINTIGPAAGAITLKGKISGTTVLTAGSAAITANLNGALIEVEMVLTCRDLTTPSAAVFAGSITFKTVGVTGSGAAQYVIGTANFTGTVDTTAAMPLDITFQWGTSNAGNTLTTSVGKVDTETPG
jgi:hypothetical protein